jgi:topoisomerase-4 subunit A
VQKSRLIERIAELLEQKKLPLLDDIHDESAEDIRIVLTPKSRAVEPEILMEQLFRASDLEARIPLNMNVLDRGLVPRVMSLKDVLLAFAAHRREVLERRSSHRLEKIRARLEILDGYLAVFLNLDKVIRIIRNEDEPKPVLIKAFRLTDNQAEAILNMRLRSLRKLEEMEIRGEHKSLTQEQADLTKLLKSEKLKSERLIAELKDIDAKFGLKTRIGKRRTEVAKADEVAEMTALAEHVEERAAQVAREPITVVCSAKGWLRALSGHKEQSKDDKYREGDRARFWIHAQTTDQIMLLATDGRFLTLDAAKLPGGRGNGEAIRSFIDLPPEADIVTLFAHVPGRKLLVAANSGHGFVTSEDDAVAMTRKGKQVLNVKPGVEAASCRPVSGDSVAVVGDNRKLLIFPLEQVPELGRGQGVYLQRYKDGGLADATSFTWKDGLKDENNRLFQPSELREWRGERAQAGRIVPHGWAKSKKFGEN